MTVTAQRLRQRDTFCSSVPSKKTCAKKYFLRWSFRVIPHSTTRTNKEKLHHILEDEEVMKDAVSYCLRTCHRIVNVLRRHWTLWLLTEKNKTPLVYIKCTKDSQNSDEVRASKHAFFLTSESTVGPPYSQRFYSVSPERMPKSADAQVCSWNSWMMCILHQFGKSQILSMSTLEIRPIVVSGACSQLGLDRFAPRQPNPNLCWCKQAT